MEYESLLDLAKAAAALAVEARVLGQDGAAWDLVQAGGALEDAAGRARVVEMELEEVEEEAETVEE